MDYKNLVRYHILECNKKETLQDFNILDKGFNQSSLNLFLANVPILYPMKISEKL